MSKLENEKEKSIKMLRDIVQLQFSQLKLEIEAY